jgi:nucleotide-binding universal stress UspA family protein
MRKILIAVDSENMSVNAIKFGLALCEELKGKVALVDIVKNSIGAFDAGIMPKDIESAGLLEAKSHIAEIKSSYPDVSFEDFEVVGKPHEELNKIVALWNADMVVIGQRSHTVLDRIFKDSVEKQLLNTLNVPLIVVPQSYTGR